MSHDNMLKYDNEMELYNMEDLFTSKNWSLIKNIPEHIIFNKKTNNYDYFEIFNDLTKINVTIPIKNSQYQYKTHFDNYIHAFEFVEFHLLNYES